jgi:uncharacterized FAD-dependent dehydrogenase
MQSQLQLILTPEQAHKEQLLKQKVAEKLEISADRIVLMRILKKSIDARAATPKINIVV